MRRDGYFENEFCFEGVGAKRAKTRRSKIPAPNRTLPNGTSVPESDEDTKKVIKGLANSGKGSSTPKEALF